MKMLEEEEEDRISSLQDCLLLEILSRLPSTKEVIRTGILSKRWQHIWTYGPTLIFRNSYEIHSEFFSYVDRILTHCNPLFKLKEFEVDTYYDNRFESQLRNWIRYAISRNVEKLTIMLSVKRPEDYFMLDQSFFINSCITDLCLFGFKCNPGGSVSWTNLKSLKIETAELDEDLIENILSGCPISETLLFENRYGYRKCYVATVLLRT